MAGGASGGTLRLLAGGVVGRVAVRCSHGSAVLALLLTFDKAVFSLSSCALVLVIWSHCRALPLLGAASSCLASPTRGALHLHDDGCASSFMW